MRITSFKHSFLFGLCLALWISSLAFTGGFATANADTQPPTAPTGLTASDITRTSLTLQWTAATDNLGIKEYLVYRNDKWIGTTSTNSYAVTSLLLNTSYKLRVLAVDQSGNRSKSSATLTVKTLADNVPPAAPTGLQAHNVGLSSFLLTWQAATDDVGVTRYEIYLDGLLKATTGMTKNKLATSVILTGLKADTTYTATVKAFDRMNNGSEVSLSLAVETLPDLVAPLKVSGLGADQLTAEGFRLTWERSADNVRIAEYEVFRNGTSLGKTNTNQWMLSGLQPATAHELTVVAYDESNNASPVSLPLTVTTSTQGTSLANKLTISSVSGAVSKGATTVNYRLAEAANLTAKIYSVAGQLLHIPIDNLPAKAGVRKLNLNLAPFGSGEYLLIISAKKTDGPETSLLKMLTVDLQPPVIAQVNSNVNADSSGSNLNAQVSYTLSERANVTITVRNASNRTIRIAIIKPTSFPGQQTFVWDGRNSKGVLQAAGDYRISIDAKDLQGTSAIRQTVSVVVRPAANSLFSVFDNLSGVDPATTGTFSRQSIVRFNPARWAFTSGQINWANYPTVTPFGEQSVFNTELTHRAASGQTDRNWTIRIGKGGNIYSMNLPVVGEISPPSFRQPGWNLLSPWNDDGMTTTLNSSTVSNNDAAMGVFGNGYIHGSGMYLSPAQDPENNKPFHSPQLAEEYDAGDRSYATVNWGLVPKPSVNRGDIMIYSKYRDVGNGVLELNYYYYNFGEITYDFAEAPWWMVRRSLFPDQIRGTTGANYEIFDRTYGVSHTFNVNSFAGWGASTQDASNPSSMTAAMVWGKDKHWSTQSALQSNGGDFWQKRTSAAAYGKVNDLARDGQLLTSVIFPIIKPGEGFHFRRYLVFGQLANVAQTAASLVEKTDYQRIEFASATSGRLPLYQTVRDGQPVLSTAPPSFNTVPIGYSSPVPLKGSQPLMLMKNVDSGQYFLSTDPYAVAGKKPFVNPYQPSDPKYETYQNRVIYQPYDGNTEWISLLGYVVPAQETGAPAGYKLLSEATSVTFVKGDKRAADQLLLFAE